MIPKPLSEIIESDILRLKADGVGEGKTIEYKEALPGTSDQEKREFLADVSSFANADGGDIIFGVSEDQGFIVDVVGVSSPDLDAEVLRYENMIRDGVSPRMNPAFQVVQCTAGRLMIIRIEKSWNRPHRVVFRGHDKFYGRTAAGKFPLDVTQLREAFLQSLTVREQIQGFRIERIIDIANDRAPALLVKAPMLALHIIPVDALSEQKQFDVTVLLNTPTLHQPLNSNSGWSPRMTFDGVLIDSFANDEGRIKSYAHFFRNGILEAVTTSLLQTTTYESNRRYIPHVSLERNLLEYLPRCFDSLNRIGVRPPVFVCLTLIGVRGLSMAPVFLDLNSGNSIREETLIIPGRLVEDFSEEKKLILKPMFDRVWNACGQINSPNFNEQGNWAPPRG